jgi:hypothetical protein
LDLDCILSDDEGEFINDIYESLRKLEGKKIQEEIEKKPDKD